MSDTSVITSRADVIGTLMNARSIAIVGATNDPTRISGRPLHFLLRAKFAGNIYPVNPSHTEVQGIPCYPSVSALPEAPDVAVLAVPAGVSVPVVEDCARLGVPIAVVTSGGFAETGADGQRLQRELEEAARQGGVRLLGPNCLGAYNAFSGMYATFSQTLMSAFPNPGPAAVISQSGAYGAHLGYLARQRNIDIGYWVTTGNEADIDVAEVLNWLAGRPEVRVIMAYVEGVRDGPAFLRALERARVAGKPVIVLKTGRSQVGARMANSHTGALAGADDVYNAVFAAGGAYRARSIEEQLDVAYACAHTRPRPVGRLGVVTVSGGVGAHICDAADTYGLAMPTLPDDVQRRLLEMVPYASVANPVDCTGQALQDASLTSEAFRALLERGECDAVLGFYSTVCSTEVFAQRLLDAMESGTAGHRDALLVICMVAGAETIQRYEASGALVFEDPDRAVRAIAALSFFGKVGDRGPKAPELPPVAAAKLQPRPHSETDAKSILAGAGVPMQREILARTADEAAAAAEQLGLPVAVKVVSPDVTHKSDVGAVVLGIADAESVRAAYRSIMTSVRAARPDAVVDGVLVTAMAAPGTELIVGAKIDPVFGPVIMVGLGGVHVETLGDVALRLAPVDHRSAMAMLDELTGAAILKGSRGREPADLDAVADCLVAVSRFAAEHREDLSVVEINPLVVYSKGRGAVALDAVLIGVDRAAPTQSDDMR